MTGLETSSIYERQNQPDNLRLLTAAQQLYGTAKNYHYWRIIASIGLAIAGLLAAIVWDEARTTIALLAALWTIISRLTLLRFEQASSQRAANISEQFDCSLFELPWNSALVGQRLSAEDVLHADCAYRGNRDRLKNWYADAGEGPYPLPVLVCQRASLRWDSAQRRIFVALLISISSAWFIVGLTLGVILNLSLRDFLVSFVLPSLPAFLLSEELIQGHLTLAREKERMHAFVSNLWDSVVNGTHKLSLQDCRTLQDFIYTTRTRGPFIPGWLYMLLRPSYEKTMAETAETLNSQLHSGKQ